MTVTRGEVGGDNGRKEGRVFKNNYKKPRGRVEAGEGDGDSWGKGVVVGGGKQTTVLQQQ